MELSISCLELRTRALAVYVRQFSFKQSMYKMYYILRDLYSENFSMIHISHIELNKHQESSQIKTSKRSIHRLPASLAKLPFLPPQTHRVYFHHQTSSTRNKGEDAISTKVKLCERRNWAFCRMAGVEFVYFTALETSTLARGTDHDSIRSKVKTATITSILETIDTEYLRTT